MNETALGQDRGDTSAQDVLELGILGFQFRQTPLVRRNKI